MSRFGAARAAERLPPVHRGQPHFEEIAIGKASYPWLRRKMVGPLPRPEAPHVRRDVAAVPAGRQVPPGAHKFEPERPDLKSCRHCRT
jgi:hypothetical protein